LIKLKEENGSALNQDVDPIIKSIDKELAKPRKSKSEKVQIIIIIFSNLRSQASRRKN
jgi:hypothetical protein